jgi:hypothetical protein
MNVLYQRLVFRSLIGLAVFGLTLNLMAQHISEHLRRIPEDMIRAAQLLGSG